LPEAVELADGLRNALKARELVKRSTQQTLGTLTLSIGIAVYRRGEPPSDFVQRADRCLYAAKHAGRDRVATDAMSAKNNVAGAA
jgi:diguanylate cyclase